MRGIRFGSSACSRAFSAWEASRIDPPDEDDGEASAEVTDYLNIYVNGVLKGSDTETYNPNRDNGFNLLEKAVTWWAKYTKRGRAHTWALREAYPSMFQDLLVLDSETMVWANGRRVFPSPHWFQQLKPTFRDAAKVLLKKGFLFGEGKRPEPCKFFCKSYGLDNGWQFTRASYGSVSLSCRTSAETYKEYDPS